MGNQKKIKAVKNGMVGEFSEKSWSVANPEKNGWKKIGDGEVAEKIEAEEIKKEEIKVVDVKDPIEVKEEPVEEQKEATREEMMKFLVDLAEQGKIPKKPHHALGDKKLKEMYDENTK